MNNSARYTQPDIVNDLLAASECPHFCDVLRIGRVSAEEPFGSFH